MVRVLVVNPPSRDRSLNRDMAGGLGFSAGEGVILPPLELASIAARLVETGYEVKMIDAIADNLDSAQVGKMVDDYKPEWVLGNLALPTLNEDIEFYKSIKKKVRVLIKTGINYPQILKEIAKKTKADWIIYQEIDDRVEKYLKGEADGGSARLRGSKVVIKPPTEVIQNLDQLPIPKRELLDVSKYKYVLLDGPITTMQTSRGCPYPCGFYCPYPLVQGKVWRAMNAKRIVDEIAHIKKLGINNILFRDATFTLKNDRIKEMCRMIIKKKLGIKWWCETRINVLNGELIEIMAKAGCQGINVGIETLDQDMILRSGKPGVSLEAVIKIRGEAKKYKVKLHFLMIIGLPEENLNTINNTYDYLVSLKPESCGVTIITPYPGTPLFDQAVSENLIRNFDWNKFTGSVANMRTKYLNQFELLLARKVLMWGIMGANKKGWVGWLMVGIGKGFLRLWKRLRRE